MTFKVLFFNVGNGLLKPERLRHVLEESKADLVGLAELTSTQADVLRGLNDLYPSEFLNGIGIPGKGLLSRNPLRDAQLIELYAGSTDLRVYAMCGVENDTHEHQVIVAHPPPQRTRLRQEQLGALLKLATTGEPT